MNNRLFFVVNPAAGNGKAKKLWPEVQSSLQSKGWLFDFVETTCKGDGIRIAREAAAKNYKCYLSIGGDGTYHEMINGLMQAGLSTPPTTFLLPVGTGNDFVRQHKIPKWGDAWLQMLERFQTKSHNLGFLSYVGDHQKETRYFINVAGLFYDGYIVRAVTLRKKPIRSSVQYLILILKFLFRYRPPKGRISWPGGQMEGAYYTANIGICRYSGGGMCFVPHANPFGDGFAVTVSKKMHPIRVLLSTPYFYNGKVARHGKITCLETERILIEPTGEEEILVEADGEYLGKAPCELILKKKGFLLVC